MTTVLTYLFLAVAAVVLTVGVAWLAGLRYIPHGCVGIVEKIWAQEGSLTDGRVISLDGRAGFQAEVLRGGVHLWLFPWQYRIHRVPLVLVSEGKIGYVYARDGEPLPPTRTLGAVVPCNCFQDARAFLEGGGQRGRQRGILREGLYAVNLAQFVVITADRVFAGPVKSAKSERYDRWREELAHVDGFSPVVVGHGGRATAEEEPPAFGGGDLSLSPTDTIGVVTVHDGPPIESGEIIAPEVRPAEGEPGHGYFQDPEAFLALGGRRGKQLQVLTDGTFFVNRWFATVEIRRKTLVPIGYVGVIVSYHGVAGEDVTGAGFRYGEQVDTGHRGVWKHALPPGKYPLNPYALKVELVPTVNFVLRWITGRTELHQYDEDLKSIEIITADGFEPTLPLSLVLHIDYEKAPRVVQRFGDVKRLISQTLDPILSSYFRDVAQTSNMLDLLTKRDEIQRRATEELGRRFRDYDINCVAVLIGRPEAPAGAEVDPIEHLFDQLRQRRLAQEQLETYERQKEAAAKERELNDARAAAERQAELTRTKVDIEIAGNRGAAELAEAKRLAKRDVARARGESRAKDVLGQGEAARISRTGLAEAEVFLKKIQAYGDPRLFALNLVSRQLARSRQPLVPERLMTLGGGGGRDGAGATSGNGGADAAATTGLFGPLLALLLGDRAGLECGAEREAGGHASAVSGTEEGEGPAPDGSPRGPR